MQTLVNHPDLLRYLLQQPIGKKERKEERRQGKIRIEEKKVIKEREKERREERKIKLVKEGMAVMREGEIEGDGVECD